MGSGSLAAMGVFEAGWKENMEREDAKKLVASAIKAGIFNDLGSGSNVDLVILTKDGTEILRNYEKPNPRPYRRAVPYAYARGTTPIIGQPVVLPLERYITVEQAPAPAPMEITH